MAAGVRGQRRDRVRAADAEPASGAAKDLVAYTQQLVDKVDAPEFTFAAFQIANGAKELLDEVATGKVTGEEEIWSHTDLWDFQANVDGRASRRTRCCGRRRGARPRTGRDARRRGSTSSTRCSPTHGSLDAGFKPYDELTDAEVQALAAAVDAVGEPLSSSRRRSRVPAERLRPRTR